MECNVLAWMHVDLHKICEHACVRLCAHASCFTCAYMCMPSFVNVGLEHGRTLEASIWKAPRASAFWSGAIKQKKNIGLKIGHGSMLNQVGGWLKEFKHQIKEWARFHLEVVVHDHVYPLTEYLLTSQPGLLKWKGKIVTPQPVRIWHHLHRICLCVHVCVCMRKHAYACVCTCMMCMVWRGVV